jgi:hypothetical protein
MSIFRKKFKLVFYFLSFFLSVFVFLMVFQNCSNVHLAPIETNTSECVDIPLKIDQDATGSTTTTTRFFVSDLDDDNPVNNNYNWSVEGTSQTSVGPNFTFDYAGLDPCGTYAIHAKYQGCSDVIDLVFHYTPGTNCSSTPPPPPPFPPPPAAGCPNTITAPNGQVFTRQTFARYIERHVNDREQQQGPVDTTAWTSIFGRAWPPIEPHSSPWPGSGNIRFSDNNYPPGGTFNRTGYVALSFIADPTLATSGEIVQSTRGATLFMMISLSETCGEFENVPDGCKLVNPNRDIDHLRWTMREDIPAGPHMCRLIPNHAYYLNIRMSDQTQLDPQLCPRVTMPSCPPAFEVVKTE